MSPLFPPRAPSSATSKKPRHPRIPARPPSAPRPAAPPPYLTSSRPAAKPPPTPASPTPPPSAPSKSNAPSAAPLPRTAPQTAPLSASFSPDRAAASRPWANASSPNGSSVLCATRAPPRDLVPLGKSLARVDQITTTIENAPAFAEARSALLAIRAQIEPIAKRILAECIDSPPSHLRDGGLFRDGVDAELDESRLLQKDGSTWLVQYQERLITEHQLPGIKVGYNKIFGYYIELTASQSKSAPAVFSRKQTLKNAERYITPELKDFEDKVT